MNIQPHSRLIAFALAQVVIVPLLAIAAMRAGGGNALPLHPSLRNKPRQVLPLYDYPLVVSNDQLRAVLQKLAPPRISQRPKLNHIDHALRLWGVQVAFEDSDVMSGAMMRDVILRDDAFRQLYGTGARPLLHQASDGWRIRIQEGHDTSSHVDHSLSSIAEVGVALQDRFLVRVGTSTREVPMGRLVLDAIHRFGLNQQEYEWTALLLGLYGDQFEEWCSIDGERISMDRIARRIMRQEYGQGCCYGGHRLFTLASLLRIDQDEAYFSDEVRGLVEDHLAEATCRLVASQSDDGYWGNDWPGQRIVLDDDVGESASRLLATGHALEWWAIAPESCQPPRERLVRAAQWLVAEIEKMDDVTVVKNYTFLTHAARALALWRGDLPGRLWQRLGQTPVAQSELNSGSAEHEVE